MLTSSADSKAQLKARPATPDAVKQLSAAKTDAWHAMMQYSTDDAWYVLQNVIKERVCMTNDTAWSICNQHAAVCNAA